MDPYIRTRTYGPVSKLYSAIDKVEMVLHSLYPHVCQLMEARGLDPFEHLTDEV